MNIKPIAIALALSAISAPLYAQDGKYYSLNEIIELAVLQDHGLSQINSTVLSLKETGIASSTLMDPKMKIGVGGLPIDSFQFDDDPMTNISIGLAQQFSRGSTLNLSQQRFEQQSQVVEQQLQLRKLDIANNITRQWIELQYLGRANQLTEEMRDLMGDMTTFIQTNYSLGKSEAQDLLFAEMQVSKLDEKLQQNQQMQQRIRTQLSEWVGIEYVENIDIGQQLSLEWTNIKAQLNQLPENTTHFYGLLTQHPKVLAADKNILTKETQVRIAEEAYAPQFGVEVGYAYRQSNGMNGKPASDLVSAYLTMDIPLFTDKRQDRSHAAAQYQVGAAKSQKDLLLVQMNAQVNTLFIDKSNLEQRIERYQSVLIKQAHNRTKAIERGYENNTVQFNELILATRDELTMAVEEAKLLSDLDKTMNQLAYTLNRYDQNIIELSVDVASRENK
ncbi:TolC family protein [Vibrio sp. DW001]|uniref:TolC family protein n=1 Tax=Vibrio sp. DW001 TaxID=2912315 RepID=UPI0023B09768|nr:TolC family protein [Vibrio sp. DW001]WED29729.1 TolC family protein [Vibrio sp. DW001]